jgi:hypothetical protein
LEIAIGRVTEQTDNLTEMLEDNQENINSYAADTNAITDADIDRMIYGSNAITTEADIDKELNVIREELNNKL